MKTKINKLFFLAIVLFTAGKLNAQNTFPATGSVGIGTTSPVGKLNVTNQDLTSITGNGSVQIGVTTAKNLVIDNDEIQARTTGVASTLLLNNTNAGNISMCNGNAASKGGSVSIGKAVNYGRLNISADSASTGAQTVASFGTDGPGITIVRNWPGIYYNAYWDNAASNKKSMAAGYASVLEMDPVSGSLYFSTSGNTTASAQTLTMANRVTFNNTGYVGIGTTNPHASLQFNNVMANRKIVMWESANNDNQYFGFGINSGILRYQVGDPGCAHIFYSGTSSTTSAELVRIQGNGNVGIGTGSTSYKLDVCGTIRAKEIRVETGWCDFVFANDYKLRPLSEVESFINENKHLPDVTSGPVIENEGLEVGKVSSQMIRKIEELTLYVIELQKQVDSLKAAK